MTINERVKYLRKDILHKTQEEFSPQIRISRSNLGAIEIGRVNVTDRVVQDICNEFNINEIWLRTGEGGNENIFAKVSEDDRFALNVAKIIKSDNDYVKNAINYFAETDPDKLLVLMDFFRNVLGVK